MNIAVLILNWNAPDATRRTVAMVQDWNIPGCIPVIVDNGSEPPLSHVDLPAETIHLRAARNRGFAGGVNLAFEALPADAWDALLLLNSDASINAESIMRLSAVLAHDPTIAVVGPLLKEVNGAVTRMYAGGRDIARHMYTRIPLNGKIDASRDVDYVPGTVCLIRRSAFDDVGRMDEAFFFSGEVADFCRRARARGLRCVIVPDAIAEHDLTGNDTLRNELYAYYQLRNRFLYVRRAYAGAFRLRAAGWALVGTLMALRSLLHGRGHTARALMMAVQDGLKGRFGDRHERFGY